MILGTVSTILAWFMYRRVKETSTLSIYNIKTKKYILIYLIPLVLLMLLIAYFIFIMYFVKIGLKKTYTIY